MLIVLSADGVKAEPCVVQKREWRRYSKESLNTELSNIDWNINVDDVQQYWNLFENELIKIVDLVATLVDYHDNVIK